MGEKTAGKKKQKKLCSEPQMEAPGLVMLTSAFLPDLEAAHSNFTGVQTQKKKSQNHKAAFK